METGNKHRAERDLGQSWKVLSLRIRHKEMTVLETVWWEAQSFQRRLELEVSTQLAGDMRCSPKFAVGPRHTWLFYKLNYLFWVVIALLPCSKSNLQRKPQWSHASGRELNTFSVLGNLASSPTSWFLTSQKVAYELENWNNLENFVTTVSFFGFSHPPSSWSSRNSWDRGWWELITAWLTGFGSVPTWLWMTFNCMDSLRCQPGWFRCHTSGQVLRCHSLESVNSLLNYTHERLLLDYFVVKSSLLYLCAPQPIFRLSMDISKSHKHPNNPKSPERKLNFWTLGIVQWMVTPWGHPWKLKTM